MSDTFEAVLGWGLVAVLIIVTIAFVITIVLFPIFLWHQVFGATESNIPTEWNITITVHKGEFWFCMVPDDHLKCNFTEPAGDRFRLISDFIQFLGNGPTIEREDKDDE